MPRLALGVGLLCLSAACAQDLGVFTDRFACVSDAECADGFGCDLRDLECRPSPWCGDGVLDEDETCDLGTRTSTSGCTDCDLTPGATCDPSTGCAHGGPLGVALGAAHRCWIEADRSLTCIGANVGPDGVTETNQARVPPDLGPVKRVAAGDWHTCVVRADDTVACFGSNLTFAKGEDGTWTSTAAGQATVPATVDEVRDLGATGFETCAVRADRRTVCWGRLSRAAGRADRHLEVSVGRGHACARDVDGAVECWGDPADDRTTPPDAGPFRALGLGRFHSCGIAEDGRVHCWGRDTDEIGRTVAPAGRFEAVVAGQNFTCARDRGGAVECWGRPPTGSDEVLVRAPPRRFVDIAAGPRGVCGITIEAEIVCFGEAP